MHKQALDSGDIGYGVLGGVLGGGAGWLLGRLIHGNNYKRSKLRQLLFTLAGLAAGGGVGTLYGKTLANELAGPANTEANANPEGTDRKGKKTTANEVENDKDEASRARIRRGATGIGALAGFVKGNKLGEWWLKNKTGAGIDFKKGLAIDVNGNKYYIQNAKQLDDIFNRNKGFIAAPGNKGKITDIINEGGDELRKIVNSASGAEIGLDEAARKALQDQLERIKANSAWKYDIMGRAIGTAGGAVMGNIGGRIAANLMFPVKGYSPNR